MKVTSLASLALTTIISLAIAACSGGGNSPASGSGNSPTSAQFTNSSTNITGVLSGSWAGTLRGGIQNGQTEPDDIVSVALTSAPDGQSFSGQLVAANNTIGGTLTITLAGDVFTATVEQVANDGTVTSQFTSPPADFTAVAFGDPLDTLYLYLTGYKNGDQTKLYSYLLVIHNFVLGDALVGSWYWTNTFPTWTFSNLSSVAFDLSSSAHLGKNKYTGTMTLNFRDIGSVSAPIFANYTGEVQPNGRCVSITTAGPISNSAVTTISAYIDYVHGGADPKVGSMLLMYTLNGTSWSGDLPIQAVSP